MAWSSDGERLATTGHDGQVFLWQAKTGVQLRTVARHAGSVVSLVWQADGRHVAGFATDGTVRIWNTEIDLPNAMDLARITDGLARHGDDADERVRHPRVQAWISEDVDNLVVGAPTLVSLSIPTRHLSPPADVTGKGANVDSATVLLMTDNAVTWPHARLVRLDSNDESADTAFEITPVRAGSLTMRFMIFSTRSGVLLQELWTTTRILDRPDDHVVEDDRRNWPRFTEDRYRES
jgi:WD40 repeat protein